MNPNAKQFAPLPPEPGVPDQAGATPTMGVFEAPGEPFDVKEQPGSGSPQPPLTEGTPNGFSSPSAEQPGAAPNAAEGVAGATSREKRFNVDRETVKLWAARLALGATVVAGIAAQRIKDPENRKFARGVARHAARGLTNYLRERNGAARSGDHPHPSAS